MISAEYLAGYFDGEGFITMSLRSDMYISINVGFVSTDKVLIDDLLVQFPRAQLYLRGRDTLGLSKKPCWNFRLNTLAAKEFVDYIYPHVRLKSVDLDFYYKWYDMARSTTVALTDEIKNRRRDLHAEYKAFRLSQKV